MTHLTITSDLRFDPTQTAEEVVESYGWWYLRLSTTYHGKKVDGFFGGVGQMSF